MCSANGGGAASTRRSAAADPKIIWRLCQLANECATSGWGLSPADQLAAPSSALPKGPCVSHDWKCKCYKLRPQGHCANQLCPTAEPALAPDAPVVSDQACMFLRRSTPGLWPTASPKQGTTQISLRRRMGALA